MSATGLEERVAEATSDELVRLCFGGPITASTASRVRELIRARVRRGDLRLLVDLRAVTTIDVSGIAALLDARRVVEAREGGVLAFRVNATVDRALRESGTISAFRLWHAPEA
ncbi:MAG: STAS domain-containing protein [Candidatus Rokubacteria bacterium]|nr:STAS domain-containing protein [Candidatus Rokubacteria bacterium]